MCNKYLLLKISKIKEANQSAVIATSTVLCDFNDGMQDFASQHVEM